MPSDRASAKPETPHYHGHRDRLRERLLRNGAAALADYELLELILFGAKPRGDTKPEAKALIARFGGLGGVLRAGPEALTAIPGIGENSAAAIKAVAAAMERVLSEQVMDRPVLGSWQKLLDYCGVTMGHAQIESFRLLFLDVKNALIRDEVQQTGTIDHTPVYPREVIKRALELGAAAFIMVHNHPSGDPTPSRADIDMTKEVARAAAVVGIQLHDHLIIGRGGKHASLKAMGLI